MDSLNNHFHSITILHCFQAFFSESLSARVRHVRFIKRKKSGLVVPQEPKKTKKNNRKSVPPAANTTDDSATVSTEDLQKHMKRMETVVQDSKTGWEEELAMIVVECAKTILHHIRASLEGMPTGTLRLPSNANWLNEEVSVSILIEIVIHQLCSWLSFSGQCKVWG